MISSRFAALDKLANNTYTEPFGTLDACYVASWQLPRPDFHRLADDSFAGHTNAM